MACYRGSEQAHPISLLQLEALHATFFPPQKPQHAVGLSPTSALPSLSFCLCKHSFREAVRALSFLRHLDLSAGLITQPQARDPWFCLIMQCATLWTYSGTQSAPLGGVDGQGESKPDAQARQRVGDGIQRAGPMWVCLHRTHSLCCSLNNYMDVVLKLGIQSRPYPC